MKMTNTALRAENSNSRTITFKSREHEKFYEEYLKKCRYQDVYHQALVYCLGIDRDTRNNVDKIYNFKTGCVKTERLQEGWQTSGSYGSSAWHLIFTAMGHQVSEIMKQRKIS